MSGPRDLLAEQPLAARPREGVELQVHVLIFGRNPRVSDLHHHDFPTVRLLCKRYRKTIHFCEILLPRLEPTPCTRGPRCVYTSGPAVTGARLASDQILGASDWGGA